MLNVVMTTALKDIDKSLNITVDVSMGVRQGIAYPGLGRQIDNFFKLFIVEQLSNPLSISQIGAYEPETILPLQLC